MSQNGVKQSHEQARGLERRGELLLAYDVLVRGLAEHPADPVLRYRTVLCLARSGATKTAEEHYEKLHLGDLQAEDSAALAAPFPT